MTTISRIFAVTVLATASFATYAEAGCREMLGEMRILAGELRRFERSETFKTYGFGQGSPHSGWLDRAKKLQSLHNKKGPAFVADIATGDVAYPEDITDLGLSKLSCATKMDCDPEHIADIQRRIANMRCR